MERADNDNGRPGDPGRRPLKTRQVETQPTATLEQACDDEEWTPERRRAQVVADRAAQGLTTPPTEPETIRALLAWRDAVERTREGDNGNPAGRRRPRRLGRGDRAHGSPT